MSSLDGILILAADNDPDHLEILLYLISQEGGTLKSASSGREALELLLTCTPDVLVLDISMPDMDGYELLATIRGIERLRHIPAVAVTALAYASDRERCLEAGFVEHVIKPYEPFGLIQLLSRLVGRSVDAKAPT